MRIPFLKPKEDDQEAKMEAEREKETDAAIDRQEEINSSQESNSELVETQVDIVKITLMPSFTNLKKRKIIEDDDENSPAKEFLDLLSRELTLGNVKPDKIARLEEYNELIGYESRRGYWRIALSDMRSVASILQLSRSINGENLKLLFTQIKKYEKTKKEEKPELK